jgi:hypothetical protein
MKVRGKILFAWLAWCLPVCVLAQQVPDPQWSVARAQFATRIADREPVDEIVVASPPVREVYFFTDLRHLEGRVVTHRWELAGQIMSVVPFAVAGPRWRVYSRVEIEPEQTGDWSVTVVDESGWPLHTELFRYLPAAPSKVLEPETDQLGSGSAPASPE